MLMSLIEYAFIIIKLQVVQEEVELGRQGTFHPIEKDVFQNRKAMSLEMAQPPRPQQNERRLAQGGRLAPH